jgi:hypothetical protein
MDTGQILFIIIAIGFSILSLSLKSKKQKQSSNSPSSFEIFEQNYPEISQQNVNIYPKSRKTKQKAPNIEIVNPPVKSVENTLQNSDLEIETSLLKDFEGTELQKAFLYSEIFKNTKN